jgi:hypothetical protein
MGGPPADQQRPSAGHDQQRPRRAGRGTQARIAALEAELTIYCKAAELSGDVVPSKDGMKRSR